MAGDPLELDRDGVDAFRAVIDRAIDLTLEAQRWIEADDRFELVTPASLGVVTFRRRGLPGEPAVAVDRRNERIVASLAAAGDVLLTSTFIGGRYTIRLCVLNHSSDLDDVLYALERVATAEVDPVGAEVHVTVAPERAARQAAMLPAETRDGVLSADDVRTVAALASVSDAQADQLLAVAREEVVPAGSAVTERWAQARTFYIVKRGTLDVQIDDRVVNRLGPGDAFGEVAAIDWGRDFNYGRTATVVAVETSSLIAVPAAALRALMADAPEVDREIRRIAQERLAVR
jgi:aromatic-L-amino-acid/L-tryptophan decarboxylase